VCSAAACRYPAGLVHRVAADGAGHGELVAVGGQHVVDQYQQPLDLAGIRAHGGVDHLREAEQDLLGAVGEPVEVVAEDPVVLPILGVVVAVLDDVVLG
jgi:hypothetical protein